MNGIDTGLLPRRENVEKLKTALEGAKKRWLDVGISKFQPKWHYVFDGHLLDQYEHCGGLADKSDETIEKGHQEWKRLRQRFWRITNFEVREKAMVTAWRRRKHPNIQQALAKFRSQLPRQSPNSKRERNHDAIQESVKEEKTAKRSQYTASSPITIE